jgi:hypothetical protein
MYVIRLVSHCMKLRQITSVLFPACHIWNILFVTEPEIIQPATFHAFIDPIVTADTIMFNIQGFPK